MSFTAQVRDDDTPDPSAIVAAPRWTAVVAVALPTMVVGLHALVYGRWIVDDAAISFAYARSLSEGNGPVLMPGAGPVEGFSNPAWTALLVIGRWLGLFDHGSWLGVPDYVAFPKALALALCAVMFTAYFVVAKATTSRPVLVTSIAGAATAAVPSFVIWVMSGLENSLLAAAVTWIAACLVHATVHGRLLTPTTAVTCGVLAALAALARPDGAIYVLAYPVAALLLTRHDTSPLRERVSRCATSVLAFAVPMACYVGWRVATFGMLLPNTAVAKSQGLPGFDAALRPLELVVFVGVAPAALTAVLAVLAVRRRTAESRAVIALLVPLGAAIAAYAVLEEDWMGQRRFATPIWAIGSLVLVVTGTLMIPHLRRRSRRMLFTGVVAATVVMAAVPFVYSARTFRAEPTVSACAVASYAGWRVNDYADYFGVRDGAIATPDVGGAAMVSRLRVIDLAGLTDHRIAQRWAAADMSGLRDDVLGAAPEFILIHGGWTVDTGLITDPRFRSSYTPLVSVSSTDGLWVRRDLVANGLPPAAELDKGRSAGLSADDRNLLADPLSSCGDVLDAGPNGATGTAS